MLLKTEGDLVAAALALGAETVPGWSAQESTLAKRAVCFSDARIEQIRRAIEAGRDPLGDAFSRIRSPEARRKEGATYTPPRIIQSMLAWAARQEPPVRIVDPGTGSARFLLRAARRFPTAELVGVELDPLAALMARANLAASGFGDRAEVRVGDYRRTKLEKREGRSLFLGNPPYVRHHLIDRRWKNWLAMEAGRRGHRYSQLAGLHIYFFLATVLHASPGDFGAFITAAEWLDVNYGEAAA